jgi:hypothetical protein
VLSLSVLFVVAFLREVNTQQTDAMSDTMDIRILAESVPKVDIGGGLPDRQYVISLQDWTNQ